MALEVFLEVQLAQRVSFKIYQAPLQKLHIIFVGFKNIAAMDYNNLLLHKEIITRPRLAVEARRAKKPRLPTGRRPIGALMLTFKARVLGKKVNYEATGGTVSGTPLARRLTSSTCGVETVTGPVAG